jgi:hypothetical protein
MPDPSPRDQLPGRPSALEMENAKLRKALAILSNIQTNAAAALVGLREDFGTGSNHDGPLNDANELEFAREETRMGQVDLRMSEAALASSRAETKVGQADLLASEVALAASQVETKIGLADLLASAVELAASRAEAKISVRDLLASAVALSLSRAETIEATNDLRDREGQITSLGRPD